MKEILSFLKELKANNNREWFNANKERYLQVREKAEQLCAGLIGEIAILDPSAALLRPSDCMYRIYRDTRFSPDKTPYKTHIGLFINPPYGKKSPTCGYYLHIEPGNCFFCAGTIALPTKVIQAVRQSIYDEIDEYLSIIGSEDFKKCFSQVGDNLLKTMPKGFPKDWKHGDLLRPRDFMALSPLSDCEISRPGLQTLLRQHIVQAKRFNDFINYTIVDLMLTPRE